MKRSMQETMIGGAVVRVTRRPSRLSRIGAWGGLALLVAVAALALEPVLAPHVATIYGALAAHLGTTLHTAAGGGLILGATTLIPTLPVQHPIARNNIRKGNTSAFQFVAGATQPLELPIARRYVKKLWFRLRGTMVISGVTVPGKVHSDGIANLVQQLEILIDGNPWKKGLFVNFLRNAQTYDATEGVNDGIFTGAAGSYDFEVLVPIYGELPSAHESMDGLVDGTKHSKFAINVTWGQVANVLYGNTSTVAINNCALEVYPDDTAPFEHAGDFLVHLETETTLNNIQAGGAVLPIPFIKGAVMRSLLIRATDGNDLTQNMLTGITIRVNGGEELPLNQVADKVVQGMKKYRLKGESCPDGYYLIEFPEGGIDALILSTGLGAKVPADGSGSINGIELVLDTAAPVGVGSLVVHITSLAPSSRLQKAA